MLITINNELTLNPELVSMIKYEFSSASSVTYKITIQAGALKKDFCFLSKEEAIAFKRTVVAKLNGSD